MFLALALFLSSLASQLSRVGSQTYVLDDSIGLGRQFDGIGGLSGGGATSRLLVSYKAPQRDQILDLLFKPQFGADLQILKVEIGGDAQSTDGTESSHMHSKDDFNYQRGYEWWLMTEAKKRNPDIKLYGLPWAFPAWVGNGSGSPYTYPAITADYIVKWIRGAKQHYNLDINYIGIWNEKHFNITYIKTLRHVLDSSGLSSVQIVASDDRFKGIAANMLKDPDLNASISIIGAHYPGTYSDSYAERTHKPLWASEDYSTFNDDVGAGCWARILNQNYVNGNITSTIAWNLIASYYSGLPYFRDGLMTATEPWSGHYEVMGPIWITAHTTQFSEIGYYYLKQGYGAGHLASGGSYVTLYDLKTNDFSIIIETMTRNHSVCVRPDLPPYNVTDQTATFQLKGSLGNVTELNCWISSLKYGSGEVSEYFQEASPVMVKDGTFSVTLPVDTVMTLSTLTGQKKGSFPSVPPSAPFPLPYSDDFDDYPDYSEAQFFADQTGVFEITNASDPSHGKVMRQVVPTEPINWCYRPAAGQPNTIIGNSSWHRVFAEVSVLLEGEGTAVFLAARMSQGGCGVAKATGVFLWLDSAGFYNITTDLAGNEQLKSGRFSVLLQQWYTLQIKVEHTSVSVRVSGNRGASVSDSAEAKNNRPGFVALGTGGYYPAQFDNFSIDDPA